MRDIYRSDIILKETWVESHPLHAQEKLSKKLPLKDFRDLGFKKMNGESLDKLELDSYLLKMGRVKGDYRYFIVYRNYLNILSYNCSNYYGLSVGLLSDYFK